MKKLLSLFGLNGLYLVGCQNSNDFGTVGPDNKIAPTSNS